MIFLIVFVTEMIQDNSRIPYYEHHLKENIPFDPVTQEAVIRCSICTGERSAGFLNKSDGHFTEVMVIRTASDLQYFLDIYEPETIRKIY